MDVWIWVWVGRGTYCPKFYLYIVPASTRYSVEVPNLPASQPASQASQPGPLSSLIPPNVEPPRLFCLRAQKLQIPLSCPSTDSSHPSVNIPRANIIYTHTSAILSVLNITTSLPALVRSCPLLAVVPSTHTLPLSSSTSLSSLSRTSRVTRKLLSSPAHCFHYYHDLQQPTWKLHLSTSIVLIRAIYLRSRPSHNSSSICSNTCRASTTTTTHRAQRRQQTTA